MSEAKQTTTQSTKRKTSDAQVIALKRRGDKLRESLAHDEALGLYSEALAAAPLDLDPESKYELLAGRTECYKRLGNTEAGSDDVNAMIKLAESMGDVAREITALNEMSQLAIARGELKQAEQASRTALKKAEKLGDRSLEAASRMYLGDVVRFGSDPSAAEKPLREAVRIYREIDERRGQANSLRRLGRFEATLGDTAAAIASLKQAVALARATGDRECEAHAINGLAIYASDHAESRALGEQALAIFESIGDRPGQSQMFNNLGLLYGNLGLYETARDYVARALEGSREFQTALGTATYLESLGRAELDHGDLQAAERSFQEGLELAIEIGHTLNEAYYRLGLGRLALDRADPRKAFDYLEKASRLFRESAGPTELSISLAWQGYAQLRLGDWEAAHALTSEAVAKMETLGDFSADYPPQDVWWLHYQVLKAAPETGSRRGRKESVVKLTDTYAWMVLQRARQVALVGIATLSDEGLRRNYLNKVPTNRQIITEWVDGAQSRGTDLELDQGRPGNLQDQLKRMLAIGARMNERRDLEGLLEFIMDQLIELSGAERVLLAYMGEEGERQAVAARGFASDELEAALDASAPLFDTVSDQLSPVLLQEVSQVDPEAGKPENVLNSLSVLGLPLISRGQLTGLIYLNNHTIYGPFNQSDVDLLSAFANQAASAIENARLYQDLEQRVADRTAELETANTEMEQRAAELSIINSVQQGLASQLEFDAIIELVGDKMRKVFNLQNLGIRIYEPETNMVHFKYSVERGVRLPLIDPMEPAGFARRVIETREPIVVNQNIEEAMKEVGSYTFAGTESAKSLITVPIISGDQVTGIIMVGDLDRENAFDEADVRLLTTLAASMGVAFENARLFQETTRLLSETEQRAAELEIISSVEQALASKLEIQEVYDLVGEKIREVFDAQTMVIMNYHQDTDKISFPYFIEKGERHYPEPGEVGGLARHIIDTHESLMINRDLEKRGKEFGMRLIAGEWPKSWLGVPLIIGDEAFGVITLQNIDTEDAFDEADQRLLTTLASSMSVALENVRLFDETRRRAAEMAALAEIAREVSATLDLTTVLEQIGGRAMELLNARTINLRLIQADSQTLKTVVALGRHAEQFTATELQLGEGITGTVAQTGKPEVINDTRQDQRTKHVPGTPEDEPTAMMIAPLRVGKETIGTMGLWRALEDGHFSNDDLNVLVSLSRQAAIAIQNARLFHEVGRQKDYSESLVLNSPVAIVTIDESDNIVSWNPEAEELFGYTGDEAIGQNIDALLVSEDMREESIDLNRQAQVEGAVQVTTKRRHKDGSLVDVELHGVALSEDGKAAGSIAIYHNISELKQTEDELREQKDFFEGVLSSNPAAIAVADQNVEVIAWNSAAEQLFGYTEEEVLGKNLDNLVARGEDLHNEATSRSEQIKTELGMIRFITQRTRKDGSRVDVEISSMPVISRGRNLGYIAIYYDISDLLEAQRAAEAANEAKSAFLATMSHEIRTPMNAIIGMTSLLLDTELSSEQLEFTEIVRDSGDSLLTIINDILDFSKIEAGKFELESQPFDLRECIEGALDLIAPKASEKRIDLAYEYGEGTPEAIHGDVTRLRQIFVNLLNNAVKFTEKGEVVLEVEPENGKKNALQFCIRDTGIGIPLERMDRLFQSFSQVDISTSRKYGGTGLGLAISKRLSELMGGSMWVESNPGEGSTFHFTISAKPAPTPKRAFSDVDSPDLAGKRVLIVDDNATNRKILTRQLLSWDMTFMDTDAPKQALEWVASGESFEAAILDMHMPEMDGLELAIEIRKTEAGREIPLLMLTSLGGREEVRAEDRVEFAAFLTKPIKPSQLFNALSRVFAVDAEPSQPKPEAPTLDTHMADRLPLRILLAEDNVINQKVALRILSRLGYRADVAGNGLEAIDALERQPYDVVLMDMQMPELDGLDATRHIRKEISDKRQPRIIATTANAMEGDRELCLEAGMDDYVSKPLRIDELVRALSESRALEL
jgi:PAS domain S-box-containing protein